MTSLEVPVSVRDRLAAAAVARGFSVSELLDDLSRRAGDPALMDQVARQMVQVRDSDPSAWSDYIDEGSEWEQGTVEIVSP